MSTSSSVGLVRTCNRLGLECYFRPSKTRVPKKRATRLGALEDKVDKILGQMTTTSNRSSLSPQAGPSSQSGQSCDQDSQHPCDVIGRGLITYNEANQLLDSYRTTIPCFPFVQIPKDATVDNLRSERPFLLFSILFVSSFRNVPLNLALEEVSTSYLGGQILQGDRPQPMDMLQGLLVTIAGTKKKHQLTRIPGYMRLAQGIISDTRLDYPAKMRATSGRMILMADSDTGNKWSSLQNEEMRALVGYYLLDASRAITAQRAGNMPWSPFLESCAAKLSHDCEFPTDRYLLGHVQLQRMLSEVDTLVAQGYDEIQAPPSDIESMIHCLQSDMDEYKSLLPAPMHNNIFSEVQSHFFDVHLWQTAFFDVYRPSAASIDPTVTLLRTHALCQGLAAAKRFISYYFSLPFGIERTFSYLQWTAIGFGIATACRLTLAALDRSVQYNANVQTLRETLDIPRELLRIRQRLREVDTQWKDGKADHQQIIFYQDWVWYLSGWFEEKCRMEQSDDASASGSDQGHGMVLTATSISDGNFYGDFQPQPGVNFIPWSNAQDYTIEDMFNTWVGGNAMPTPTSLGGNTMSTPTSQ
ncbi:hypothetical protein N7456_004664 [Penicillium angulare]|uniref:Transcription factor n=1 Tax=Penicillium angulare TaxID=116970 RepID=A0A9W9FX14_9EURO|nr:hypothetical protein N7456_004664 [Penicillium angulare]